MANAIDEPQLKRALDANTDDAVLTALGLTKSSTTTQEPSTDPLAAARARGEQAKRDLLAAQGDMLDAAEVAARLGIDPADVCARTQHGLLLALPDERGVPGYPAWQFTDDGLLPGLDDVLRLLPPLDTWSRIIFLTAGDPALDGRTPLELLRRGEINLIQKFAAAYDELVST